MKSRVLSLAMALCMIAVVFTALPTKGAVYYTGSVQTMNEDGVPMDVFFWGDHVYVNVTMYYEGVLVDVDIRVQLVDQDGVVRSTINTASDDPVEGYYNSTTSVPVTSLNTGNVPAFSEDAVICEVVVWADLIAQDVEVAREPIVLRNEGITLDPEPTWYYYPGQTITMTIATSETDDFYVQILDEEDHDLVPAWTHQTVDEDGLWVESFTIPDDALDGWCVIQVLLEDGDIPVFGDYWFYVAKFAIDIQTDRDFVLPGETVTIYYMVFDISSLALYSEVTTEWNAVWYDLDGEEQVDTGTLTPGYFGSAEFDIPDDINLTSDYTLFFWVNDTDDRSFDTSFTFQIGALGGDVVTDASWYLGGEVVSVMTSAWVYRNWYPLPEAEVDIKVEKDGVAIPSFGATSLMTGTTGMVEHDFILPEDAEAGTYVVTATISKLASTVVRMTTFDVELQYSMEVELDKDDYYSGETATASFVIMWGTEKVTNSSVFYIVSGAAGNIAVGNTTASEVSFVIPADYVGWIGIEAVTVVEGYFLGASDSADVWKSFIAIAPVSEMYTSGETIQWDYQILTAMTTGMLSYVIQDDAGNNVVSTAIEFSTGGTITYTVPATDASTTYTITLTLKDGLGNNAEASSTVWLESEYKITIWVSNDSGYVSRAFEPGDNVQIGYEITTNGAPHKSVYKIRFYSSFDYIDMYILTSSTSGTLTMAIPDDVTDGAYGVSVILYDGVDDDWSLSSDWVQVDVMSDQSGWSKEIAGMSAIDFTILVLIVVMIVLLIVVPFLKERGPSIMKSSREHESPVMAPEPPEPPK